MGAGGSDPVNADDIRLVYHGALSMVATLLTSRLTTLESNRYDYWSVALRYGFEKQPLRGIGPGGFQVVWLQHRHIAERARVAHSLYIETLAELGIVGFALLLAFLGGLGGAALRAYRANPVLTAGPIAGVLVWLVHCAVDWDWQMPALSLVPFVLAGLLIGAGDARTRRAERDADVVAAPSRSEPVPA